MEQLNHLVSDEILIYYHTQVNYCKIENVDNKVILLENIRFHPENKNLHLLIILEK